MSKKLKGLVCTALDNAYEGGYEEIAREKPGDVALSLQDYDADVANSGASVMDIVPYVEAWQRVKLGTKPDPNDYEYAGFHYSLVDGHMVPRPGQHPAASKLAHRLAARAAYAEDGGKL